MQQVFIQAPEANEKLWGGEFWTDGYYIVTVSGKRDKMVIEKYIENQGSKKNCSEQLNLFGL